MLITSTLLMIIKRVLYLCSSPDARGEATKYLVDTAYQVTILIILSTERITEKNPTRRCRLCSYCSRHSSAFPFSQPFFSVCSREHPAFIPAFDDLWSLFYDILSHSYFYLLLSINSFYKNNIFSMSQILIDT
jgi:hypothetical protein